MLPTWKTTLHYYAMCKRWGKTIWRFRNTKSKNVFLIVMVSVLFIYFKTRLSTVTHRIYPSMNNVCSKAKEGWRRWEIFRSLYKNGLFYNDYSSLLGVKLFLNLVFKMAPRVLIFEKIISIFKLSNLLRSYQKQAPNYILDGKDCFLSQPILAVEKA